MKRKQASAPQEEDIEAYTAETEEAPWRSPEDAKSGCHVSIRRRRVDLAEMTPKKLNRILKNREAAQASRERKKTYVADLEASKDQLQSEAVSLRHRVEVLETEKCSLSSQVYQLKSEFDQLRALILGRSASFSAELLVDEQQHHRTQLSLPQSSPPSVTESSIRMDLRPTAPPATTVLPVTSSPSIITVDRHNLGSHRATLSPLSDRNHCLRDSPQPRRCMLKGSMARRFLALRQQLQSRKQKLSFAASVAPLTLHLLKTRQRNQTRNASSLMQTYTDTQRSKRSAGSMTASVGRSRIRSRQMQRSARSSTWSRRMSISDLMNILISKYQPK